MITWQQLTFTCCLFVCNDLARLATVQLTIVAHFVRLEVRVFRRGEIIKGGQRVEHVSDLAN